MPLSTSLIDPIYKANKVLSGSNKDIKSIIMSSAKPLAVLETSMSLSIKDGLIVLGDEKISLFNKSILEVLTELQDLGVDVKVVDESLVVAPAPLICETSNRLYRTHETPRSPMPVSSFFSELSDISDSVTAVPLTIDPDSYVEDGLLYTSDETTKVLMKFSCDKFVIFSSKETLLNSSNLSISEFSQLPLIINCMNSRRGSHGE